MPDRPTSAGADDITVACLCAAWCHTCTDYQATLAAVAAARPGLRFAWIDIEDDADALGDDALDVENFPTLMLLRAGQPLFYGTLLPHAATLNRLLAALVDTGTPSRTGAAKLAPGAAASVPATMAAAVWRLAPGRPLPR